jgi:curli biogenesis system outer membrane secretion channel CsgG
VKVIERSLLGKVLSELKIQNSGAIEVTQVKEIGKLAGVDAILTGLMYKTGLDELEINSRLIETGTGEILASSSKKVRVDWLESLPQMCRPNI